MFEPSSRYLSCEDAKLIVEGSNNNGGRTIVYKKRRFIPSSKKMSLLQEIVVTGNDRLDLIAVRTLGDPEQFWQICDANDAMHPIDLTSEPGMILRIAIPWKKDVI